MEAKRKAAEVEYRNWLVRAGLAVAMGLALAGPIVALAGESSNDAGGTGDAQRLQRHHSGLDERIKLLARELDLDAKQQSDLKRVLEEQRERVVRAWADGSVPAGVRVQTTQKISERTSDQIRALLSEEQRKRYIQPKSREMEQNQTSGDVESWMAGKAPNGLPTAQQ